MQAMQATSGTQAARKRLPRGLRILTIAVLAELLWLALVGGAAAAYVSWQRGLRASYVAPSPLHMIYSATDLGVARRELRSSGEFGFYVPDADSMLNSYGQVAGSINDQPFLWTPTSPHGATGIFLDVGAFITAHLSTLGMKGPLSGITIQAINNYGQLAGIAAPYFPDAHEYPDPQAGVAFLWTPDHPHGITGRLTLLSTHLAPQESSSIGGLNDWGQVLLNFDGSKGIVKGVLWAPLSLDTNPGTWDTRNHDTLARRWWRGRNQ